MLLCKRDLQNRANNLDIIPHHAITMQYKLLLYTLSLAPYIQLQQPNMIPHLREDHLHSFVSSFPSFAAPCR